MPDESKTGTQGAQAPEGPKARPRYVALVDIDAGPDPKTGRRRFYRAKREIPENVALDGLKERVHYALRQDRADE